MRKIINNLGKLYIYIFNAKNRQSLNIYIFNDLDFGAGRSPAGPTLNIYIFNDLKSLNIYIFNSERIKYRGFLKYNTDSGPRDMKRDFPPKISPRDGQQGGRDEPNRRK